MEEVFPDRDLRHYVHKAVGYSLTGDMREQCFFFLHGNGQTMENQSSSRQSVDDGRARCACRKKGIVSAVMMGDDPLRETADIPGARLVLASQTEEGERLNEGVIKRFDGRAIPSARRTQGTNWRSVFRRIAISWIYGNDKPTIRGTDCGIWRRVRLIPFTQKFERASDDLNLGDKLRGEAFSQFLNWAVRGCLLWQLEGLKPPEIVQGQWTNTQRRRHTCGLPQGVHLRRPGGRNRAWRSIHGVSTSWGLPKTESLSIFVEKLLAKRLRKRGWHDGRTNRVKCLWRGHQT